MSFKALLALASVLCFCHKSVSNLEASKPYLGIMGPMFIADGIGRVAPEIAIAVHNDFEIEILPTNLVGIPRKKISNKGIPQAILNSIGNSKKPLNKVLLFTGLLWGSSNPEEFSEIYKKFENRFNQDRLRIAYTMFESNRIPPQWVNTLNNYFDVAAVPDEFFIDVYKNSGVNIPVFVLPMPLNMDKLYSLPLKTERKHPLVFGSLSSAIDRKNLLMSIRAFVKAFGANNNNVELRINCRYDEQKLFETIKEEISTLQATNIKISESWASSEEYIKLLQSIDVYVSLSKGEGFSIQPREAMAMGIPVIVTDNTALHTICESKLVRAVPSNIEQPATYYWNNDIQKYGVNFNCSVEDAALAFLDVYNNYDAYLKNGEKAREWTRQYHPDRIRSLYKSFLKPQKIILGDEDKFTSEYLVTTSKPLYEKWKRILDNYNSEK